MSAYYKRQVGTIREQIRKLKEVVTDRIHLPGYACELEEEIKRLTGDYSELSVKHLNALSQIDQLEATKRQLGQKLTQTSRELEGVRGALDELRHTALEPLSASDFFHANNHERWFSSYDEDYATGVISLTHGYKFYPCNTIVVARGALRLRNCHGFPAILTQCYEYSSLLKLGCYGHLLPKDYKIIKMRVLFGKNRNDGFWLQDPRSAEGLMLEIRTNSSLENSPAEEVRLRKWEEQYRGITSAAGCNRVFDFFCNIRTFSEWRERILLAAPNREDSGKLLCRILEKLFRQIMTHCQLTPEESVTIRQYVINVDAALEK